MAAAFALRRASFSPSPLQGEGRGGGRGRGEDRERPPRRPGAAPRAVTVI